MSVSRVAATSPPSRLAHVVLVLVVATLIGCPGVALAHETTPPGVEQLEISLGARQLGLTITTPPPGGGSMSVVLVPRGDTPPGSVTVGAVRAGADIATAAVAVPLVASPAGRTSQARFDVEAVGPWELVVTDGPSQARIPIDVPAPPPTPGWVWALRVGGLLGVLALIAAVTPAARRRRAVSPGLGAVAVAGLSVAVTAAVLGPSIPADPARPSEAPSPGMTSGMGSMPGMDVAQGMSGGPAAASAMSGAVVATVRTAADPAAAGAPVDLELALTDGSTGAVVDDLTVHDDALIHLAVIGPDQQMFHVHPVRVAPGRFRVSVRPATAGRYGVFAEMQRVGDSGHQVARTAFDVAGPTPAASAPVPGVGRRDLGGAQVDVSTTDVVAGRPSRISLAFSAGGAPVRDLQSWLGMAGHLIVLGPGSGGTPDPADPTSSFGHVHDMSPPGPNGRYGPVITFDHTFARPGRYLVWAQVQRDWQTVTIPVAIDVAAPPGSQP